MDGPLQVTLDTNMLDAHGFERLRDAIPDSFGPVDFRTVTVNVRERGSSFDVETFLQSGVWGESTWGESVWSGPMAEPLVVGESRVGEGALVSDESADIFEEALQVVSNGSFPKRTMREGMSAGHRRQLRDAMTFLSHVRERRHVLVSADADLTGPRTRERLQELGSSWLLTPDEFEERARAGELGELRTPPH